MTCPAHPDPRMQDHGRGVYLCWEGAPAHWQRFHAPCNVSICSILTDDLAAGLAHERDVACNKCTMLSPAAQRHLRTVPSAPLVHVLTEVPQLPRLPPPVGDTVSFELRELPATPAQIAAIDEHCQDAILASSGKDMNIMLQ